FYEGIEAHTERSAYTQTPKVPVITIDVAQQAKIATWPPNIVVRLILSTTLKRSAARRAQLQYNAINIAAPTPTAKQKIIRTLIPTIIRGLIFSEVNIQLKVIKLTP
ncbi:MAG: hypothetical protein WAM74_09185, partial [Xanthobacteraceae bacterium]